MVHATMLIALYRRVLIICLSISTNRPLILLTVWYCWVHYRYAVYALSSWFIIMLIYTDALSCAVLHRHVWDISGFPIKRYPQQKWVTEIANDYLKLVTSIVARKPYNVRGFLQPTTFQANVLHVQPLPHPLVSTHTISPGPTRQLLQLAVRSGLEQLLCIAVW